MRRVGATLCVAAVIAAATLYALAVIKPGADRADGIAAFDIYAYFYPNIRYALDSLARGSGLLWNPYQNCGQPFFAFSVTGLLYPVNAIFALLPREPALLTSIVINLTIAGLGGWWLGRELGWSMPAALAGALAFELGGTTLMMASWSPMHIGAYAWMAAALAAVERLLRLSSMRAAILLGIVLTLQLLPGFPQISVYTYQVIALRVGWQLLVIGLERPWRTFVLLGVGLAIPVALPAVQLWPSLEVARDSVRSLPLHAWEIGPGVTLASVSRQLAARFLFPGTVLTAVLAAVATLGLVHAGTRRLAVFYLLVAALFLGLALGDATPLLGLYQLLPLGSTFRGPDRFLWVTGFALAVLAGLGVEAIVRRNAARRVVTLVACVLASGVGVALFALLHPRIPPLPELVLLAVVVLAVLVGVLSPRTLPTSAAGAVLALALAAAGLFFGSQPLLNHRTAELYDREADALNFVRPLLAADGRAFLIGRQDGFDADFALMAKSATLFRIPSIFDYEPQASLRYAQYFTYMRLGKPLASVYDWYRPYPGLLPLTLRRPLFDLTAARYVVVHRDADHIQRVLGPTAVRFRESGDVRVYWNRTAFARARFVPRMVRMPDAQVLRRLASGEFDLRRTALVGSDVAISDSRIGVDGTGTAKIIDNEPQHVVVEVEATAPGFLYLADQHAPGWLADVDGKPAEIMRANHVFRLVAVPEGRSRVTFRYAPLSVRLGAAVSLATALLLAALWWRDRPAAAVATVDP